MTQAQRQDDPLSAIAFPPATRAAWEEAVRATLKGRGPETLRRETLEGIVIEPVYAADDAARPLPRMPRPKPLAKGRGWAVLQRINLPDEHAARAQRDEDLAMGANGVVLVTRSTPFALGFGLGEAAFAACLDEWDFDRAPLRLDAGLEGLATAHRVLDALAARHGDLSLSPLLLNVDPFGAGALAGALPAPPPLAKEIAGLARRAAPLAIGRGALFVADTRVFHAAGCGEAQELALALAATAEILRLADGEGVAPEKALPLVSWLLIADADQFLTMAKMRAARLLHARLAELLDAPPRPLLLQAESAWRTLTRRDPWVNLLRAASAAFAAGLGGADAITLLPFTAALGLADGFARRMARNAQIIALEESHLDHVADPAAGSAWVDALTRALAEKAWEAFREIESHGGLLAALRAGLVQERIAAIAARRARAVARREIPVTGVSTWPLLDETPPAVIAPGRGRLTTPSPPAGAEAVPALTPHRLAEPFEALRDAADAATAARGARPMVFNVQLGRLSGHGARSTWALNLFAAGGLAVKEGPPEGYAPALSPVVVVTGADAEYDATLLDAVRALKAAGARAVHVVARPPMPEDWRTAGVDALLHEGMDVPAFLADVHAVLGISDGEQRS